MNIIYDTKKFFLIPFLDANLTKSNYYKWMHDQEVTRYNSHGLFPYSKREEEAWQNKIKGNEILVWAIIAKTPHTTNDEALTYSPGGFWEDGDYYIHIGNISLQSINWVNRSAEVAIVIGEKGFWGSGIATESLQILIDHGFEKLNLHRIWSGTAETNRGMLKVFQKLKMTHEGTFKDAVFLNGEYVNVQCWAILRRRSSK